LALSFLSGAAQRWITRQFAMRARLINLLGGVLDEIGCDECFRQLDEFVEMALDGKDAAEAMPLVWDHLERCGDCREEFEALLAALHALTPS
jgi:hypothetical protein